VGNLKERDLKTRREPVINSNHITKKGEEMAGDLFLVLGWGSPIGVGIFLALLGSMIFLIAKADQISKRTKAFEKEKGMEKKSVLREKLGSPQ
jgi:hypothetical protein